MCLFVHYVDLVVLDTIEWDELGHDMTTCSTVTVSHNTSELATLISAFGLANSPFPVFKRCGDRFSSGHSGYLV